MIMRCPADNCRFDVPEAFVGTQPRCRYCGTFLVDAQNRQADSQQVQEGPPPGAAQKPDPREPSNLENQIYDGLPPLSVMLALRQRKGGPAYDQDDLNRRYPMTPDDWKALAAFEKALHASAALTMAFWIGLMALAGNLLLWFAALGLHRTAFEEVPRMRILWVLGSALAIPVGVTCVHVGTARLSRIMLGAFLNILPWCTLALSAVYGGTAVWYGVRMFSGNIDDWLGGAAIFCVTANAVAFLATCAAAVHVWRALTKVRPPEVAHRLTEALKYLA